MIWYDAPGKVVLLGQAPSRDTDGAEPFSGRSGKRIAELMGIEHRELRERFALANVLERWPGPSGTGKGDAFPVKQARKRSRALRAELAGRRVVVFGHQVAHVLLYDEDAASTLPVGYCAWPTLPPEGPVPDVIIAWVPHPSGVNRWWNDRANLACAKRFLRSLVVGTSRCAE